MYYIYKIMNDHEILYIGITNNIRKRCNEHNSRCYNTK